MRDNVALVTGAGSGLGAAIAVRLAADGAVVAVNDIDSPAAQRVAEQIGGVAVPFDVADPDAVERAVASIVEDHGRLDVLVNNAGIAPVRPEVRARGMSAMAARLSGQRPEPVAATSTLSDGEWDRMLRVHLYGTFHCTRAALRVMEPARQGAVVNMASIAGLQGIASAPEYSAAKGGIVAFTRSVGAEVAPLGIRVNAVAPAYIDTPLLGDFDDMTKAYLASRTGAGRLGRPEEVAAMVRFLAGDEASFCFGEVLTVTGAFA